MPQETTFRLWLKVLFRVALALIFVLSLLPSDRLPHIATSIWDKAQHALAFTLLAVLALLAWPGRPVWRTAGALLLYGIAIEWAQAATGWRHGDAQDVLADAVGVAIGCVLVAAIRRLRARSG